jgi:hypothetical protein
MRVVAMPGALHVAGNNQKVDCVARQAVNGRGYHHVAGGELLYLETAMSVI